MTNGEVAFFHLRFLLLFFPPLGSFPLRDLFLVRLDEEGVICEKDSVGWVVMRGSCGGFWKVKEMGAGEVLMSDGSRWLASL